MLQENRLWEMGGTGRLLLSVFTLAAGSTGQMLQAATVNVIQSYGAQQIKLIADSMKSEVARTALQGILAGAGAAAQGQSATSAALGASASVVLNNLIDSAYGESSSALSLEEREARKNLVTTLITSTTQALGGEAALANAAATIETENNFLVIPMPAPPPPIFGCDNDIVQEANKNLAVALEKKVKEIYKGSEDIAYRVMVMNSRNPDLISDYVKYLKEKYLTRPTDGNQQLNSGIYPGDTKEHELSNPLKVILESIARSHSSNSKNTSDSLPKLGKNLSASEKADLGGTGAPSPSNWGPEDEQNSQNQDKKPNRSQNRVLQSGGNTLEKRTATLLNEEFGENLSSREWGRALEALKRRNNLASKHHGKTLSNGNYLDEGGHVVGNITDYLP